MELLKFLNLKDNRKRLKNRKFQNKVKQLNSLVIWWKRKYGYSSNDERYLTATLTQILEDAVENEGINYIREFESGDEGTKKFVKRRTLNPEYDHEEQKRLANMLNSFLATDDNGRQSTDTSGSPSKL